MEIKYNKDKSVTINATESEYRAICGAVVQAYSNAGLKSGINFYKPIMDAMNKAYSEQVLTEGILRPLQKKISKIFGCFKNCP